MCLNPTHTIYFESRNEYSKLSNIALIYKSPNIVSNEIKKDQIGRNVADTQETRNTYRIHQKA
jgi:hypothetical protein